jgi:hypothetical protein
MKAIFRYTALPRKMPLFLGKTSILGCEFRIWLKVYFSFDWAKREDDVTHIVAVSRSKKKKLETGFK